MECFIFHLKAAKEQIFNLRTSTAAKLNIKEKKVLPAQF